MRLAKRFSCNKYSTLPEANKMKINIFRGDLRLGYKIDVGERISSKQL